MVPPHKIKCKYNEVDWIDVVVNRPAKDVAMEWRLDLRSDKGAPVDLVGEAIKGVNHYWARRTYPIQFLDSGDVAYSISTGAVNNKTPTMGKDFDLKYNAYNSATKKGSWGRSHSVTFFPGVAERCIYYNDNYPHNDNLKFEKLQYAHTAAHEIGHIVLLDAYGKSHSWEHKGTSGFIDQSSLSDAPPLKIGTHSTGDVELMWYYSDKDTDYTEYYSKGLAWKDGIKGTIWLSSVSFK